MDAPVRVRKVPSITSLLSAFVMKRVSDFLKMLFLSIERITQFLSFIDMVYFIDFHMVSQPFIPGIYPT